MKFSIRFADQIVGTLVILALAILVFVIFMLGKSQRWFSKDYQYKSYFTSASGLSKNMNVQYKGFTIGHVKEIKLTDEDKVEVIFTIFDTHNNRVKEGSMVEVQASPIGLGNAFIFHPGKGGQLPEFTEIYEASSDEAKKLVDAKLADPIESNDKINNLIAQVENVIKMVNDAIAGKANGEGSLESILVNVDKITAGLGEVAQALPEQINPILTDLGSVSGQISPILGNLETVTNKLSDPSGTVMSVLDADGPVFNDLTKSLDSITEIMNNLNKSIEFVPNNLPQVGRMLSELNSTLAEVQKTIIALNNNPLLKGGVPEHKETGPGAATPRDVEF